MSSKKLLHCMKGSLEGLCIGCKVVCHDSPYHFLLMHMKHQFTLLFCAVQIWLSKSVLNILEKCLPTPGISTQPLQDYFSALQSCPCCCLVKDGIYWHCISWFSLPGWKFPTAVPWKPVSYAWVWHQSVLIPFSRKRTILLDGNRVICPAGHRVLHVCC